MKMKSKNKLLLHIAFKKKNIKMVKLLLSHPKIDVNALEIKNDISQTALYSTINLLLLSKPEIDVNILCERDSIFQTALHFAVERRRTKIVKLLLSNPKNDVNIQRTNASCSNYYPNNISNNNKMTALHIAHKEKCQEIVELLLQRKDIDVNIQDGKGKKPADYATK